jgi:hypothetical protein
MLKCLNLWNIIKHAGEIKERKKKKGNASSAFGGLQTSTRNRSVTIKNEFHLSTAAIQTNALNSFKRVKEKNYEETFTASVGWFELFKNRVQLHNVKINSEEAGENEDTTSKYPNVLKK